MPTKQSCPQCAVMAASVATQTIQHQLKQPWTWLKAKEPCFFCASHECDTVYFNTTGDMIDGAALRQKVGVKSKDDSALICYCFDVSRATARNNPNAKAYVMTQTQQKLCACHIRNPSGQCCLKDFAILDGAS